MSELVGGFTIKKERFMETKTWICDTCGQEIIEASHGWVEWLRDVELVDSRPSKGLRLVHHFPASPLRGDSRCQYNGDEEFHTRGWSIRDMDLPYFLGPDGLMRLLSFLAEKDLPQDEVLEMIKRLHIPGYEHARHHFDAAIADQVFEPNTREGFYRQSNIKATLEWVEENREV